MYWWQAVTLNAPFSEPQRGGGSRSCSYMCCVPLAKYICGLDAWAQERVRKLLQHMHEPEMFLWLVLWLLQLNKGQLQTISWNTYDFNF